MTRDEINKLIEATAWYNGPSCLEALRQIHDHDAEQRAEIKRLNTELSQRTNLEGDAPCWNSAHMKEIAALQAQLATAKREVWVQVMDHVRSVHSGPDTTSTRILIDLYGWCQQQKEHP